MHDSLSTYASSSSCALGSQRRSQRPHSTQRGRPFRLDWDSCRRTAKLQLVLACNHGWEGKRGRLLTFSLEASHRVRK
jgi:hypothetical protein